MRRSLPTSDIAPLFPENFCSLRSFLCRMMAFLIFGLIAAGCVFTRIQSAFLENPILNGLILTVLLAGIAFTFQMIFRLLPEIRWVNSFRVADPGLEIFRQPTLLAPMAILLRERKRQVQIPVLLTRSILDSVAVRLDESREISRYIIGLLIFLGLLGTFWGLLGTITSVGNVIDSLDSTIADTTVFLKNLKAGLRAPLSGMSIAFSSSLLGLGGALVLGFFDLQAGQAQNRFYTALEDWLSGLTDVDADQKQESQKGLPAQAEREFLSHEKILQNMGVSLADLATNTLVIARNMRSEQNAMREQLHSYRSEQTEIRQTLEKILQALTENSSEKSP